MKVELSTKVQEKLFQPYTINVTIESEDEALALLHYLNPAWQNLEKTDEIRLPKNDTAGHETYKLWDYIQKGLNNQGISYF